MINRSVSVYTIVLGGTLAPLACAAFFGSACEPRRKPAVAPTAAVPTTAGSVPSATQSVATATAPTVNTALPPATVATASPTPPPTSTPTAPPTALPTMVPPMGTWPTPTAIDPAVLADLAKKAAELGIPFPGTPTPSTAVPADPIEAALKANAAKYAPGFSPASPVGKSKTPPKQGEKLGMNFDMQAGKCYIAVGAGGPGVTQLGLYLLFPATPPNAPLASDTAHGNAPVLGGDKPLCPPIATSVRVDLVLMQGSGDVGVQVFAK